MPPRGQTAYFLFSEEHRAAAKADLAAQDGAKAGVAQVAKLVGAKWAALSDEEKQQYKDRAAAKTRQMKEEAAAAAAAQGQQQQSPGGEGAAAGEEPAPAAVGGGGAAPPPFGFPTGVVKRIMMVDDEVQRVSADAVRAIAKATELFVQQLAARALQHAQAGKRKNFKEPDVAHVAGRDRRLVDMGLREVLEQHGATSGGGGEEGENAAAQKQRNAKRQMQEEAAAGTRQITAFFNLEAT
ncbi:hypothetical protein CHLNCDRAFT_56806 [Chlorella variabilis]|uniref:HMG box domain-containing protein n=1 Tax=Chlorella variabilis TaxID=554065 RepID=E1Z3U0_CHLVA|nr:hypothetical protein CHLNCDRAFT_56806 [Chlorella variabilis]EFN59540.1 hypothetical protein CHLNCDRAFT_56806 [Chlorella variabilis]|eukprot:XP_005851642.1 hypothetical protein CHLNCDRAFT_56806 [Chlorella variabilis]